MATRRAAKLVDAMTGLYQFQSEVAREGLRLLKEREEFRRRRLTELREEIALGSRQADRSEFVDGEEAFAEELADKRPRFSAVYSYLIVHRSEAKPLQIIRALHAARDV